MLCPELCALWAEKPTAPGMPATLNLVSLTPARGFAATGHEPGPREARRLRLELIGRGSHLVREGRGRLGPGHRARGREPRQLALPKHERGDPARRLHGPRWRVRVATELRRAGRGARRRPGRGRGGAGRAGRVVVAAAAATCDREPPHQKQRACERGAVDGVILFRRSAGVKRRPAARSGTARPCGSSGPQRRRAACRAPGSPSSRAAGRA